MAFEIGIFRLEDLVVHDESSVQDSCRVDLSKVKLELAFSSSNSNSVSEGTTYAGFPEELRLLFDGGVSEGLEGSERPRDLVPSESANN